MTMTAPRTRKPRTAEAAETPLPDELVAKLAEPADAPPAPVIAQTYAMVPVGAIAPNPDNPRHDLGDLDELAASIRALGVQEPLLVEWATPPSPYRLLAGHRRLAAAVLAGLDEVPCMVRQFPVSATERMEIALVENLQRADLSALDEARGYASLVDLGLSQRAIADRVGRSQSHVSKRLALLELPSHVQARITKGTMPLEAAAALVRLKDHPDKLKKAAGEDPSAIAGAVERAERLIAWEAKRAELVEVAKGRGWPVVDEPSQYWKPQPFKTLAASPLSYEAQLDLDVAKHQAEPCHAVMIPTQATSNYNFQPPTATSICTEPARHGPKGDSTLKAKVETKPKRQPDPMEVQRAKDKIEREAAAEARLVVLAKALADLPKPRGRTSTLTLILAGVVDQALDYGDGDTVPLAAELLGLVADGADEQLDALSAYVGGGEHQIHRAALAVTLAGVEGDLRSTWGHFAGERVARHYAYLAELGYKPSEWEQAKLGKATPAPAGD